MERKRIEKLVVLLLIGILMPVSLFPFPVYADTIDSHIRGRNYTYEPITYNEIQVSSTTYYKNIGVFHITFELDDEYIGYVLPNYSIQYDNYFYGAQSPNWGTLTETFDRRIFVNGSSFSFDVTVNWNSISINTAPSGDPFNYDSYTITSSDVIKYADIDSLDQIINILQDLYNSNDQIEGLLNDQLSQLQLIVSNTSLANQYLDVISKIRQYDIPFESFSALWYGLSQNSNRIVDLFNYSYWNFPIFNLQANDILYRGYFNTDIYNVILITYSTGMTYSDLSLFFDFNGASISDYSVLFYGNSYRIIKFKIKYNSNGYYNISLLRSLKTTLVYIGNNNNISTDFALQMGLSNNLLDNIQVIASGTQQSQSASVSLDQATSQFSDDANDLLTIEESFNDSMNDSLENVSPVFNMGSSFLTSANWVSQQFNRIVNNTPFASLITFGLTLGLGLLIIGKVRK